MSRRVFLSIPELANTFSIAFIDAWLISTEESFTIRSLPNFSFILECNP